MTSISLASLNCFGMKNNKIYIEKLIENNDIVFIQEAWLDSHKKFDEIINPSKKYKTYFKTAMSEGKKRGRPHGGIGWIVNGEIKNFNCKFITKRISYIKVAETIIIGVYMHFEDGKSDTALNFENDLSIINTIYKKHCDDHEVIILGDFNTDLRRASKFEELLNNFLHENKLKCLDMLYLQKTEHTYFKATKKSWIDHVIGASLKSIKQININDDEYNNGDHHALIMEINLKDFKNNTDRAPCKINKEKNIKLNWNDIKFKNYYHNKILDKLRGVINSGILNEIKNIKCKSEMKTKLSNLINNIHSIMINTANEANKYTKEYNKNVHVKKRRWWNEEINILHKELMYAKKKYKETDFKCQNAREEVKKKEKRI